MAVKIPWGMSYPRWLRLLLRKNDVKRAVVFTSSNQISKVRTEKTRHQSKDAVKVRTASFRKAKPRKKRRIRVLIWTFISLVLLISFGVMFLENRLSESVLVLAKAKAQALATKCVNEALTSDIAQEMHYEDLVIWKTDSTGKIVAMQPNTGEINRIAALTTVRVQDSLRSLEQETLSVPMGYIFGSSLLASLGPILKLRILPVGSVKTTVKDKFEKAGINQVRHRVYMDIETYVKVVIPLTSAEVVVNTSMTIAESIILGEVPEYYVDVADDGNIPDDLAGDIVVP